MDRPVDFYNEIRPILVEHCLSCHGGVKRKADLSFLTLQDVMAPSKSGKPALVPSHVEESELFRRISSNDPDERMPAGADPLTREQIERIRRWIAEGASWPAHWAFQPLRSAGSPRVQNQTWCRNPIDRFALARLEAAGMTPAPESNASTLIRRLYLDLTGLLPTPEEVATATADLTDGSAAAYDRLIERLLASPHFGEHWGRHWLDLARYADTDGYEVDGARPNAWHWRDWVIQAVNDDMPFDQFTIEQLAGDLLPNANATQRLATAFHRQTLTNKEGGIDKEEYRTYAVMDRVSTTATVWLGLTLACAQCHDHPYDPIKQREYYQWFALFNNADETELRLTNSDEEAQFVRRKAAHEEALQNLRAMLNQDPQTEHAALMKRIEELTQRAPRDPAVRVDVLSERLEPRVTYLLRRGEFLHPVEEEAIAPGTLALLHPFQPRNDDRPADRLDLARWLVDPANPLTPRVAVNQIWMHLFGEGLVRTSDDFGMSGETPSHPELLDWLAQEFIRRKWSRKSIIKLIVSSATYRQASHHRPELVRRDPENRLLHRQNRFRVGAETVRDIYLDAAGLLSPKIGGPSVFPPFPEDLRKLDFRSDMKWEGSTGEDRYRRGMYTFFKRTLPDPNLTVFDCPDATATAVRRRHSNTPLQALATLNNEVFVEAAKRLALRVMIAVPKHERLSYAFQICFGRSPSSREETLLLGLLDEYNSMYAKEPEAAAQMWNGALPPGVRRVEATAWMALASVLLNLDEFITRE